MITQLRRRVDELTKNFNKDIRTIKKNQSELKNTITEMKNKPERINKLKDAEENTVMERTQAVQQRGKRT